tara:strand:- start:7 stop:480 length:474 start_codon:yes stop_codon:yes gene_type:complete
MAIFTGKILEAYYINTDNDTIEVIYKEGEKAIAFYLPVDYEDQNYKDLISEYSSEKISQSTLNRNAVYAKQIRDLVNAQKSAVVNKAHKTNIEDFTKGIIEFNNKNKLHLDIIFAFKVRIFELEKVKKSKNTDLKTKIRKARTPLEVLKYYNEIIND